MKIGVVIAQDFRIHFHAVHQALQAHHQVRDFQARTWPYQLMAQRMNRRRLRHDLARLLRENDVVFFEWGEQEFVVATHLPRAAPIVVRIHLHELWDFAPRANWQHVSRAIFVSHAMERKFLQRFPQMAGRTTTIHNGVDIERFHPADEPEELVMGTLSRIEPHKRLYGLLLALYELHRQGYPLHLRIGGACTEARYRRYADEVRLLVDRLDLESYVHFDGQVEDTPTWLRQIDLFVSNSCSEGLQVALLEAMASGCYCLSHDWDGVEEALPGSNIYRTEADLVRQIASYCQTAATDRRAMRAKLRAVAEEEFDIEQRKWDVVRVVEQVVADVR